MNWRKKINRISSRHKNTFLCLIRWTMETQWYLISDAWVFHFSYSWFLVVTFRHFKLDDWQCISSSSILLSIPMIWTDSLIPAVHIPDSISLGIRKKFSSIDIQIIIIIQQVFFPFTNCQPIHTERRNCGVCIVHASSDGNSFQL